MDVKYKMAIACVVAFGCGAGAGHILTKLHLTRQFEEELEEQVEAARRHTARLHKEGEFATPEGARKVLEEERTESWVESPEVPEEVQREMIRYSGKTVPGIVDPDGNTPKKDVSTSDIYHDYLDKRKQEAEAVREEEVEPPSPIDSAPIIRQNIWEPDHPALGDPQFIVDEEARKSQDPWIMTREEYNADKRYTEQTVMYYIGDETVADVDTDQPIDAADLDRTFGLHNLKSFGNQSVIFICNPRLGLKYEVMRNDAPYAETVAGFIEDESE